MMTVNDLKTDSLADGRSQLVDIAMGRRPAEAIVQSGTLINVRTGEVQPGWDVAIGGGRIARIGDVADCLGPETTVIDANGMFLVPGFCDAHVHVECSRLTPAQYARAVLPTGNTTVFEEPHELANVIGLQAVRYFQEQNRALPLNLFLQIPSAVPLSDLETAGAEIDPDMVYEALGWEGVVAVGEVMQIGSVLHNAPRIRSIVNAGLARGLVVEGHAHGLHGAELDAYAAAGMHSDHEVGAGDVLEKLRKGLAVQLRTHGWWADTFQRAVRQLREHQIDTRGCMLVTDDRQPGELLALGSLDFNVRQAIKGGFDPITSIQMVTINVATHFGLVGEIGEIAPGRRADLLLVPDLEEMRVAVTIAGGRVVAREGELIADIPSPAVPAYVRHSVHLAHALTGSDFAVQAPTGAGQVIVQMPDNSRSEPRVRLSVENGQVQRDRAAGITKLAVVERHRASGHVGVGFIRGFGFEHRGALASSVAHDSHNIVVIGASDDEMARAVNRVAELEGGIVVAEGNAIAAELPLPVGGLMSDRPVQEVAARTREIDEAARACGAPERLGDSPSMFLSYVTLTGDSGLIITDRGLVDAGLGRPVDLIVTHT